MGQGTDTCTDRPTEVSVIRFVSRNRTIEEIVPKKEIYTCKQRGCGRTFTNQDEYKTHETLEALKIRFICREPGCGEELSDPGSMWRHYQEWHNNETNVFICPYTNCGSLHTTSNNLEEHIENYHRQPPTLPTEPEVICFEDSENVIDEEIVQSTEECYENRNESFAIKGHHYDDNNEQNILRNDNIQQQKKEASHDQSTANDSSNKEDYSSNTESLNETVTFPMNENLMINTENFLPKYEGNTKSSELQTDHSQEKANVVYVNGDITITKNSKNEVYNINARNQEHRIELDNLERIFRSDLDRDISKTEENTMETNSNCSDDEEYTPKKQRMSRYKQEIYKCAVSGCGRKYKYISHYRHHQDSHKLITNAISSNSSKSLVKLKQGKASAVSFFLCKIPGCKAQVSNVTGLWKHYQDNHANSKLPVVQEAKSTEVFRCKIPGCETEFSTTAMLYKHFNEVHSNGSGNNASTNTNTKTGNGSSFHYNEIFKDDTTTLQGNFKTDFKAKNNINANDCTKNTDEQRLSSVVKKETRD